MPRQRQFLLCVILTSLALVVGSFSLLAFTQDTLPTAAKTMDQVVLAQVIPGDNDQSMVNPKAQFAIDQGLAYLAARQLPDGSFGTNRYQGNVAVTALAGLSFMAAGHQPGRGKYGSVVSKAVEYVLNSEQPQDSVGRATPGFLYQKKFIKQHGAMYEHGFGTLFLAEAYGMVYEPELRDRLGATLRRSVQLIITSQNAEGGWRYSPFSPDADLSVTICQMMALRAARNAGITVPGSVARKCISYVKLCQNPQRNGAFQYMKHGGHTSFPLTAAGVVALYSAGIYKDESIEKGLEFLKLYRPGGNQPNDQMFQIHYYYGHYYAAQAMWIVGGRYWKEWYPAVRDELLEKRNPDGSWFDSRICPHYCTAMALIVLQMPNNYLPIFQR